VFNVILGDVAPTTTDGGTLLNEMLFGPTVTEIVFAGPSQVLFPTVIVAVPGPTGTMLKLFGPWPDKVTLDAETVATPVALEVMGDKVSPLQLPAPVMAIATG
jgi:hypothetical protein